MVTVAGKTRLWWENCCHDKNSANSVWYPHSHNKVKYAGKNHLCWSDGPK